MGSFGQTSLKQKISCKCTFKDENLWRYLNLSETYDFLFKSNCFSQLVQVIIAAFLQITINSMRRAHLYNVSITNQRTAGW
jgi:hypothetical protein